MNQSTLKRHLTLALASLAAAAGAANLTAIIPAPAHVEVRDGVFTLQPGSSILAGAALRDTAKLLAARLRPSTGFAIKIKSAKTKIEPGDIVLTIENAATNLGPEGCQLSVTPDGVTVRAATATGVFYGVQSLLQLLPPEIFSAKPAGSIVEWTIPCVEIADQPRFPWRGLMLDVSRHFFTKKEVEQTLDLMALYKLNTFHWHLVDDQGWRIQIKKYPRLTSVGAWRNGIDFHLDPKSSTAYGRDGRYGGYYTQRDTRQVVAYAAARHITIVPEIEMPGHSTAALASYPQFSCFGGPFSIDQDRGIYHGIYCAGNDATFQFLGDVLAEVIPLFPGKYVHIGGDEVRKTNWHRCEKCQDRIKAEGLKDEKELQSYFIRRVEKIVNARGKTLIGWSEIREGGLAQNAALMDWIGGGTAAAASGHDVVMTPTAFCYFDHYQSTNHYAEPKAIGGFLPLKQVYAFEPVPADLPPEFRSRILGGQANLWTEYVPSLSHIEYMLFPRLVALAEVDWSPQSARDWDDFKIRAALNERRLDALGVNYRPLSKPD